jgi:integrase
MDKRYLQQRGAAWFFVLAVPRSLRGRFKSPSGRELTRIEKALHTSDLRQAQQLRWALVEEWTEKFRQARGAEVSPFHIEREAAKLYQETLAALAFDAKRRGTAPADELESLQHYLGTLHDEIEHPARYSPDVIGSEQPSAGDADDDVALVAGRIGQPVVPGTATHAMIRDAALRARYKAVAGRIDMLQGKASAAPETFMRSAAAINPVTLQPVVAEPVAPRRVARGGGWTVSQAGAALLREKQRIKLSPTRLNAIAAAVRLFADHTGDAPLTAVTRQDARAFLERVSRLRPNWNRAGDGKTMSLGELEKKFGARDGEQGLTSATVAVGYVSPLKSMFAHALDVGAFDGANPFANQKLAEVKGEGRNVRAFTLDEVKTLLAGEPFDMPRAERLKAHDVEGARFWVTMLGAFTGARLNELTCLRATDLKREDGIAYLSIAEDGNGKSEAATRRVPLHPALRALGFLDYVKTLPAGGQMFPALRQNNRGRYGDRVSRWFTSERRAKLGGKAATQTDFHSWRRLVSTRLREANVQEADVAAVLGQEHGELAFGTYGKTVSLKRLATIVAKLDYPGLRLPK